MEELLATARLAAGLVPGLAGPLRLGDGLRLRVLGFWVYGFGLRAQALGL